MWGACKGGKGGWGGGGMGMMGPYGGGGGGFGGKGKWGGGGGGGKASVDDWQPKQEAAKWGEGHNGKKKDDDWQPSKKNKKSAGNGGVFKGSIPGFKDAVEEALQAAMGIDGASAEMEDMMIIVENCCLKQGKKFYSDERACGKQNAAQAKAFLGEFVESLMKALEYDMEEHKELFEKVSWNGVVLTVVFWAFDNGKLFARVLKSQIMECIDDGILNWSEDERITQAFNAATAAAATKNEKQSQKAALDLQYSYDEAHFSTPYSNEAEGMSPEMAELQAFVEGWMTIFASKAWDVLGKGLEDCSQNGQTIALTVIFQHLLDPNSACLPLPLQGHLPQETPWPFIEHCAGEVIAEANAPKDPA